ncbi:MAG: sensor histidine kinase [Chitinophagales bacterium]
MRRFNLYFIALIVYLVAFATWWIILLNQQISEVSALRKSDLLKSQVCQEKESAECAQALQMNADDLRREQTMIATEGFVFLSLLIAGLVMVRNTYLKERKLNMQQKNFILSISHELKTPLAAMRLSTETLKKRALTKEQTERVLSANMEEIDRLTRLLDKVFVTTKLDQESFTLDFTSIDLSALLDSLITRFQEIKQVKLLMDIEKDVRVVSDPQVLEIVVMNLLDNAVKYGMGNDVTIHLRKQANKAILKVVDQGLGIPDTEKKEVFKRFYRLEDEEYKGIEGTGLGLYIVRELLTKVESSIDIENNSPNGCVISVEVKCLEERSK